MEQVILEHENSIRLGFFFGMLLIVGLIEFVIPRRKLQFSKLTRWSNNLGLVFLNTGLVKVILPLTAPALALYAQTQGIGIFNWYQVDPTLAILLSVIILDMIIYIQHALFHALPLLWRLHRMHHADMDYDVTTGLRFHPIEILLSMGIKFMAVLILGPPVAAVIAFEVLLNATAMFNHGNIKLPKGLDSFLRLFLVTPDMHRVHHSTDLGEAHKNFGFNLPWWDYLFGTYKAQPKLGHEEMNIGLDSFRDSKELWIPYLLRQPFLGKRTEDNSLEEN